MDVVQNSLCSETENVVPGWSCLRPYMPLKGLNNRIVGIGALLSGGVFGEERPAVHDGEDWEYTSHLGYLTQCTGAGHCRCVYMRACVHLHHTCGVHIDHCAVHEC